VVHGGGLRREVGIVLLYRSVARLAHLVHREQPILPTRLGTEYGAAGTRQAGECTVSGGSEGGWFALGMVDKLRGRTGVGRAARMGVDGIREAGRIHSPCNPESVARPIALTFYRRI
jgi:hypothetical protein